MSRTPSPLFIHWLNHIDFLLILYQSTCGWLISEKNTKTREKFMSRSVFYFKLSNCLQLFDRQIDTRSRSIPSDALARCSVRDLSVLMGMWHEELRPTIREWRRFFRILTLLFFNFNTFWQQTFSWQICDKSRGIYLPRRWSMSIMSVNCQVAPRIDCLHSIQTQRIIK